MKQLKPILMAIPALFVWLFALPASAARRGFNFLCAFFVMRILSLNYRWLAVCLLGATLAIAGCGGKFERERLEENCGSLRSADTCEKAKDYLRCLADNDALRANMYNIYYLPARHNVKNECGDEDAGKGSPYQQVCPAGAACNQGVQ